MRSPTPFGLRIAAWALGGLLLVVVAGCRNELSPVQDNLNTRDLVEPEGQHVVDELGPSLELVEAANEIRDRLAMKAPKREPKNVLCLSGGGCFGAYGAGVLVGWTAAGTRPCFDTVTGISTGALIAPFAFLGPKYDGLMQKFYTTVTRRDIIRIRPVRQFRMGAIADSWPLEGLIDELFTAEVMGEIAAAHATGRRLFVGTTEAEGRRFVAWDIGAIATRGREEDRQLIAKILLGSASAPGVFPPAKIDVTVDGRPYIEWHVDGGVSRALFFRPPHVDHDLRHKDGLGNLAGTKVWCVVAGKLFSDPHPLKPRLLDLAGSSVSTIIYAQTRGDLFTIWTFCELTGMTFAMTSIPEEVVTTKSSNDFKPEVMVPLFEEGYRRAAGGTAWRGSPPLAEYGEMYLGRTGTELTVRDRRLGAAPPPDVLLRRPHKHDHEGKKE